MKKIRTENIFVGNKHFLTPFNLVDRLISKKILCKVYLTDYLPS